jgi:hypothetical protein
MLACPYLQVQGEGLPPSLHASSVDIHGSGRFALLTRRALLALLQLGIRLIGRLIIQTRMRASAVVPSQVFRHLLLRLLHVGIDVFVHMLVFERAPHPLHEDVVAPRTSSVHRQLAAARQHGLGKLSRCELAALVGVDDLGHAVAPEGLFDHFFGMTGLQRIGLLVS